MISRAGYITWVLHYYHSLIKNEIYLIDRFELFTVYSYSLICCTKNIMEICSNLSISYSLFTNKVFVSWWYSIMQLSSVVEPKTNGHWDKKTNQFFVIRERNCIFLGHVHTAKHIVSVCNTIGGSIERKCILSGFQKIWHETRVIKYYMSWKPYWSTIAHK